MSSMDVFISTALLGEDFFVLLFAGEKSCKYLGPPLGVEKISLLLEHLKEVALCIYSFLGLFTKEIEKVLLALAIEYGSE